MIGEEDQCSITSGKTAQIANVFRLAENQNIKIKPDKKINCFLPTM
jgi:hypothetical protein